MEEQKREKNKKRRRGRGRGRGRVGRRLPFSALVDEIQSQCPGIPPTLAPPLKSFPCPERSRKGLSFSLKATPLGSWKSERSPSLYLTLVLILSKKYHLIKTQNKGCILLLPHSFRIHCVQNTKDTEKTLTSGQITRLQPYLCVKT